jgi:hypothetical protein
MFTLDRVTHTITHRGRGTECARPRAVDTAFERLSTLLDIDRVTMGLLNRGKTRRSLIRAESGQRRSGAVDIPTPIRLRQLLDASPRSSAPVRFA